jgi:hypothetical protein
MSQAEVERDASDSLALPTSSMLRPDLTVAGGARLEAGTSSPETARQGPSGGSQARSEVSVAGERPVLSLQRTTLDQQSGLKPEDQAPQPGTTVPPTGELPPSLDGQQPRSGPGLPLLESAPLVGFRPIAATPLGRPSAGVKPSGHTPSIAASQPAGVNLQRAVEPAPAGLRIHSGDPQVGGQRTAADPGQSLRGRSSSSDVALSAPTFDHAAAPLPLSVQALAVVRAPAEERSGRLPLAAARREQSEPSLPPAIQRLVDSGAARVEDGGLVFSSPEGANAEPAAIQRAAESHGAITAAPAAGHGTAPGFSDRDLDDLAHRLYPRLRSRFGRELLVDRERAGKLMDQ